MANLNWAAAWEVLNILNINADFIDATENQQTVLIPLKTIRAQCTKYTAPVILAMGIGYPRRLGGG